MTDPRDVAVAGGVTERDAPAAAGDPTAARTLLELMTTLVAERSHETGGEHALDVLDALVCRAAGLVGHADWASVTLIRWNGAPCTVASSHAAALRADEVQYALEAGPCLDAVIEDHVYVTGDVARDPQWPEYGRRVHEAIGVRSVLSFRLSLLGEEKADAGLNVYSRAPHAFDAGAVGRGLVLATQCALLVSAHLANERADNLLVALGSNREIGVAIGVLVNKLKVSQEHAFALLRVASQDHNRKLRDIAREVLETGELPQRRPCPPRR